MASSTFPASTITTLKSSLAALAAVILPLVGSQALAECRAPAACIACHAAIGHPTQAVLEAMAPASCEVGDFSRGLNMTSPRFIHRTAKLADGRVLLTGGQTANSPASVITNSVDIFNPADNSITPAGPMTVQRWSHTATTLADGRVLVTGGRTGSTAATGVVLATAEIYDPATNAWTETAGPMNQARRSHAATLLHDGRVLVTGGGSGVATTSSPAIQSAEIYDPATGMFTVTGNMVTARSAHSATRLADNTVLITGGSAGIGTRFPTKTAEIYNPADNTFTNLAPMNFSHLAQNPGLLRDGRLVQPSSYYNDTHTAAGGLITAESEIYDAATRLFTPIEPMFKQRIDIGAIGLLDGSLLVAGGVTTSPNFPSIFQSSSEIYDPVSGHWKLSGIMSSGRDEFSGLLLDDGRAMISGGFVSPGAILLKSVEIYTPGLHSQVKGFENLLADTPDSALRFGNVSRLLLGLRIAGIAYDVGYHDPARVNLNRALTQANLFPNAIERNLKTAANRNRWKSINQVLINTLSDKISPNLSPIVAPAASPSSGIESLNVNFASNALDSDGSIVSTQWNFGDFSYSTEANPAHTYQCDGNYTATVDVVDNRGAVASGTVNISVTSAGGPLSYACDVQPVFNRVCTGCHGASRGLSLTTCENTQAGSAPSPRPVVIPGDAANSRLVQRMTSTTAPMPPIGGLVPAAEIAAITNWINNLNPADTNFCD